jgi:hypothetical protein
MLEKYSVHGTYVDCYATEVPREVSFPAFVFAFYTTFLFKAERLILKWTVSKPSTDDQARRLSNGDITTFAAWHVESRNEHELLMRDFRGRTRSWLMILPADTLNGSRTRLYFGSAVVPVRNSHTGEMSIGWVYQALLGFHKIYSILLLHFAKSELHRQC